MNNVFELVEDPVSRTFAYCRVSTADQTTQNQILEIEQKGFQVEPHRIIAETISGSTPAAQRPGFQSLMNKMEKGDRLIVTKLDRLGRDAMDVQATVRHLRNSGVEVHCLALPGLDMGTAIGEMMLNVISAFAQFERDLLRERTHAGLKRALAQGKVLGRRKLLTKEQEEEIKRQLTAGDATISGLARKLGVSRATVMRASES